MRWLDISTENCSVQQALDVVGSKWSLQIIRELFNGVRRFEEIRRHLGVSEAVLTRRLAELTDAGVIESRTYQAAGQRARREYVPTEMGWELLPVVIGLLRWGDRHFATDEGGSWEVRHRDCGSQVEVAVVCLEHPGERLTRQDTWTEPGPAAIPRTA